MDNWHDPTHDVFQVQRVPGGLAPPKRVTSVINQDIDSDGYLSTRPGAAVVLPLSNPVGLWSLVGRLFFQDGDTLYEFISDAVQTPVVDGLVRRIVMIEHAGSLWGSDGTKNFVINGDTVSTWGLAVPTITVGVTDGALPIGRYLVQGSWSDALGNEGGVSDLSAVTLTSVKAITVTATPPANATHLNVYCSAAEQDSTSFVAKVPIASLPYSITALVSEADPPVTEQMTGPWSGIEGLVSFRAFLFFWRGSIMVHSEAQEPHLFHGDSIWPFTSEIRAAEALTDGLWIATAQGLWWVSGEDPASIVPAQKTFSPCYKGSTCVQGQRLPALKEDDAIALFVTANGLVAGLPGGKIVNLTSGTYQFGTPDRVSICCSERNKLRQLHVAMEN